jgi:hypothetical protein
MTRSAGFAVWPKNREALMTQRPHQRHTVAGKSALRHLRVVWLIGRLGGFAVAAQIRADDGEVGRQHRCNLVPGGVGARMPVQQEERRPGPAVAHAELRLADVDALEREPFEDQAGSSVRTDGCQGISTRSSRLTET